MSEQLATVLVVPRERFGMTERSLESLIATTAPAVPFLYVDAGSPPPVARYLARRARSRPMRLLRVDRFLTPTEARNLAFPLVATRYTAFVDNDVVVEPSWLEALVRCAEETGADLVGPLTCFGADAEVIHLCGGALHFEERDGVRHIVEDRAYWGRRVGEVRDELRRSPTELAEFHCMLVRTEAIRRLGPFDESLLSMHEEIDLCLRVQAAGGRIYFEPESVVGYVPPPPLALADVPYYSLRWSESWTEASSGHFRKKWNLPEDSPQLVGDRRFVRDHRRLPVKPVVDSFYRALGPRVMTRVERVLSLAESYVNRAFVRDTRRAERRTAKPTPRARTTAPARSVDDLSPDEIWALLGALATVGRGGGDELLHARLVATRAERAGADPELVLAALCHDVGKAISVAGHAAISARILAPYVRPEVQWIVGVHRDLMERYHQPTLGSIVRWEWRAHPWVERALRFVDEWDAPPLGRGEVVQPLEHFLPLVRALVTARTRRRPVLRVRPRARFLRGAAGSIAGNRLFGLGVRGVRRAARLVGLGSRTVRASRSEESSPRE